MGSRNAIVFGGSRGIGKASVAALRADGWQVVFTTTRAACAEDEIRVDIRNGEAVEAAMVEAARRLGPIGCVVANAGINVPGAPIADFSAARMRELVDVNIMGAFHVLQAAARHVVDNGAIVALTTSMVRHAVAGASGYTASKAAVESMLRSAARELAGRGVRVNGVAPGPVDTDLFRAGKDDAAVARAAALSPFGRLGQPHEIGAVVAFLVSDRASWMTGQIVQPNGGMV